MKVALETSKRCHYDGPASHATDSIRYALPFYISNMGEYIHRIRSAEAHWRNGGLSHVSIKFWCGNGGFMHKGRMHSEIPEDGVCCAACEGRAIGAGLDGARIINGRAVMYSPRSRE